MNIKVAYSTKESVEEVTAEIGDSLEGFDAKAVIFFASSKFDADAMSSAMQKKFVNVPTFGCTTVRRNCFRSHVRQFRGRHGHEQPDYRGHEYPGSAQYS